MPISLSLYLDSRSPKSLDSESAKKKEYPIKVSITKNGSTAFLPTGIKVLPNQWKDKKVVGRPDKVRLNDFLDSFKSRVHSLIYDGRDTGLYSDMTANEIKKDISARLDKSNVKTLFMSFYDKFAESRRSERTKEIYRVTARKIRLLYPRADYLALDKITLDWLEDLDEQLITRGNNATTRNLDFRNIRAVIKHALKHKLIKENPFEDFEIPEGESPDRVLTLQQLQNLRDAKVEPWEEKYRDFFFLSFYLIGMNTEDLLHVTAIENGRIDYKRAKTQKPLSIKVEPEALAIIKKYQGKRHLLNILDTYSRTHNWTSKVDYVLKEIAKRSGLPPVTMYWARHTWATIAHGDLGIDIGTVSSALGHQPDKKVTLIYIRKRDYSKVDEANRKVIDYLHS